MMSPGLLLKRALPFAIALGIWFAPVPAGLPAQSWHLFAIFVAAIACVLLGAFPLLTASMIAAGTVVLTGTISAAQAFSGFANSSVLLVVIAFIVAQAVVKSGLGRRISLFMVSRFGPMKADVRLITATHRDLVKEVEQGTFRQDLYYRLAAFIIRLPALVERKTDIPLLAQEFIARYAAQMKKPITGMDDAAKERLLAYAWPGHVRELRNVIERACILCDGPLLDAASLPLEVQGAGRPSTTAAYDLESVEREHIRRILVQTGGNKTLAAELLGIGLTTLYAKVKRYDL